MKKIIKEDGVIKEVYASNAHHLYVQATHLATKKILRKEAIALSAPEELYELHSKIDPADGRIVGEKWALTPEVIKALLENGDCIQMIPNHPLRFEYVLKPMKHSDNLRHKG